AGKPLPGRRMIVVTRDRNYRAEGCDVVHTLEAAIELARDRNEPEVFLCGGAEIYAQSVGFADRMYLTFVDAGVDADTYFPPFDEAEWQVRESFSHPADEKNQYAFCFKLMTRRKA